MMASLKALIRNIDMAIAYLAVIGLVLLTIFGVVMRYFLDSPLAWLQEVQMMLVVWLTMFGGSVAFRSRRHISIEAVTEMLEPSLRKVIEKMAFIIVLLLLGCLVWSGSMFVMFQYGANRSTDILHIPYAMVYLAVPAAGSFMIVNYLVAEVFPHLRRSDRIINWEKSTHE